MTDPDKTALLVERLRLKPNLGEYMIATFLVDRYVVEREEAATLLLEQQAEIERLRRSVGELEESVSALESERQNIIATKREQIERYRQDASDYLRALVEAHAESERTRSALAWIANGDERSLGPIVQHARSALEPKP